jgi:hypothetical protein
MKNEYIIVYPSRVFFGKQMTYLSFLGEKVMRYGHILRKSQIKSMQKKFA